jgi:shikimate dehydrogenase
MASDGIPISGRTRLVVLLADPVAQARSPALVNAALAARGRDAAMIPMHVGAEGLAAVVASLRAVRNLAGALVSMPHKTALLPLLDGATAEAREVGACNVVRREPDGRLVGAMLDGEGFVTGLRTAGHPVRGRRVLLAGAGGAAAAIAFAMGRHGAARLTIHNRTAATAEALAARLRTAWPAMDVALGGRTAAGHDLVVNATSLGMQEGDALPVDVAGLGPGMVAAEVVVAPETTPFLAAARARGAVVHGGMRMLEAQLEGVLAFVGV